MCKLCDDGIPQDHSSSRRDFLKATVATGVAASGVNLLAARPAAADRGDPPEDHGRRGRRYIIRGGSVMSMDPHVGDFAKGDVLIEGKKILGVGPNLHAGDAAPADSSRARAPLSSAPIPATSIRRTRSASNRSGSPRTTSSFT